MFWRVLFVLFFSPVLILAREDSACLQPFLETGELAHGQQSLKAQLAAAPQDDELRFGLGVLQIVRGVERLGQTLHEYGAKQSVHVPLKLPLQENADPASINALRFGRMLDDLRCDLLQAEETLAAIKDEQVHLQISWANVHLDLNGDGQAEDRFDDVLFNIFRFRLAILKENPSLRVNFDRGDVAWMRSYCHLISAFVDGVLSYLNQPRFEIWADQAFAKPVNPFQGTTQERVKRSLEVSAEGVFPQPLRLGRMRRHLVQVTELNQETWKQIRAETDDDYEWLPSPKQHGVLRLPVRDQMVDEWLAMMAELRLLLEGERVLPRWLSSENGTNLGKGIDLKRLLDDPPQRIDVPFKLEDKYFKEQKEVNFRAFMILIQMFMDPSTVGYPAWFN